MLAGAEVLGIDTAGTDERGRPRVTAVRTSAGDIETGVCVICCGVWSPRLARMAGARIPLTPIVHQMISVGPIPLFAGTPGEISYPIVRDVDTNMYERQHGGDMEVGSYAHRPIIVGPDDIPSIEESALSPTELPFTQDDFDPQLAEALELMPELLGDERVGIRYAINGLISMTPDGHPVLGETPEVAGLWSAAASWIKEGPGVGRAVAEWMSGQVPTVDIDEANIARFYPAPADHRACPGPGPRGLQQDVRHRAPGRAVGVRPPVPGQPGLRARARPGRGLLRDRRVGAAALVRGQRGAAGAVRRAADAAGRGVGRPLVVADHQRRAPGHAGRPAGWSTCPRSRSSTSPGPAALDVVQSVAVAQLDVQPGRVVYTSLLDERGGFKADLTIMRLGPQRFRVVTGGATGMSDLKWFADHLPAAGTAALADLTSARATLGLWGPRARDVLQSVTAADLSHAGFTFGTCREIELGGLTVLASRISYVGELGWELHVPIEQGARLWDALWDAGTPHGLVPVGIGVYGTTGRLEKGYRAFGSGADRRLHPGRGGDDPAPGQGAGVHRQGRLPGPAGRAARRGAVHADRGRPPRPGPAVRPAGTCWAASRSCPRPGSGWSTPRAGRRT